jgi:hypothetical protein
MRVVSLYYDSGANIVLDDDDNIVYDLFRIIPPYIFYLYKERRGTYYVESKTDKDVLYEFIFPEDGNYDEDEITTLHYNEIKNIMCDNEGQEIFNIFSIITPNTLYLFKKKKESMIVYGTDGQLVRLEYPF